jgi:hypothetical protein
MKQVFNSSEVAHIWAGQTQPAGRNSFGNFYFNNGTIYSYGSHFPIATIAGNDVLFTMRTYSNTTAKHISRAARAVSHKNLIYCYDVPVNLKYASSEHENNLNRWKKEIKSLFAELGNKRNKPAGRIYAINSHIKKLNAYCKYFKLPIKDKELKGFLKIAAQPDFLDIARQATEKEAAAKANKMKIAVKAFDLFVDMWRKYDQDGIDNMPEKTKALVRFYENNQQFTRLRFNADQNRLETSKGVQIPAEIAKRAFIQLNGCMEGSCKDINVPVMDYTITETGKDYIKAGCHTIPKSDVWYIANLLNWKA